MASVVYQFATAAQWTTLNPVLPLNTIGIENDGNHNFKIGDGVTAWGALTYQGQTIAGPQGPAGPTGAAGAAGAQGAQGPAGPTGPQGIPGTTGSTGAQGAQGAAGTNGTSPTVGMSGDQITVNSVVTGPHLTGPQGSAGNTGAQGNPGPNQVTISTSTNITGIIKGNGSAVSAASAGTDYALPSAIPVVATTVPVIDGTAAIGSSGKWADGAHVHPTDTGRASATHASNHVTGGSDVIANAIAGGNAGLMSGADKTNLNNQSGTNTGDETATTIKTKLSITTLSGSNTGDQTIPTAYASTPAMDGTGAAGSSTNWSKGDHVHPSDTSRAPLASPALTGTPAIAAATGSSLAVTGALTSSGGGVGYATGAGGTVSQSSSKSTGVTLSKLTGTITMNSAALASQTTVAFTLTNTFVAATDFVDVQHASGGTLGAYTFAVAPASGSVVISVRNITSGSLSESVVIRLVIIKAVTS